MALPRPLVSLPQPLILEFMHKNTVDQMSCTMMHSSTLNIYLGEYTVYSL